MKKQDAAMIRKWQDDGFVVLPRFYSDADIEAARTAQHKAWVDDGIGSACSLGIALQAKSGANPLSYLGRCPQGCPRGPWRTRPRWHVLLTPTRLPARSLTRQPWPVSRRIVRGQLSERRTWGVTPCIPVCEHRPSRLRHRRCRAVPCQRQPTARASNRSATPSEADRCKEGAAAFAPINSNELQTKK